MAEKLPGMSNSLYVTGLWQAIDPVRTGDNPGFQFNGLPVPDAGGRGYELTDATLALVARSVEWMIDPATGQPYDYALPNIEELLQAFARIGLSGSDLVIGSSGDDYIIIGGGNDEVYARAGNDYIDGGDGDDIIYGQEGNDTIRGGPGNDFINGGTGIDTAIFSGIRDIHGISGDMARRIVASPEDGQDTLVDVERLQFLDGTLAFDTKENAGQAYRLYQAAFDRVPDTEGLGYWIREMDKGVKLNAIADSFINSPEFVRTYGTQQTVSNAKYVELLYRNTLGRDYDQSGFDYWLGKLDTHATNRADLLAFFSESDENQARVADAIADGIWFT